MDKEWMCKDRLSHEYDIGVESFLQFAMSNANDPNAIPCPCARCGDLKKKNVQTIRAVLGVVLGLFGAVLRSDGAVLGCFWRVFGVYFGAVWRLFWGCWERFWVALGGCFPTVFNWFPERQMTRKFTWLMKRMERK